MTNLNKLHLHSFHEKQDAKFKEVKGWQIPAVYSSVNEEIEAVLNKVGLLDRSYLGKIIVKGTEASDLIDRISTNDMKELIMGTACDTIFCTPKGRIIDYAKVLQYEDQFIIISSYLSNQHLIDWINRFIILEDIVLEDCSENFIWLTLMGPDAKIFIGQMSNQPVLDEYETIWLEKEGIRFPALINNNFMVPSYNFCLPKKEAKNIIEWMNTSLVKFNGKIVGDDAFQVIRIESAMPDWGTELTEDYNPHEARLLNAVSFTKGCYTGQEIIARLDTYDKVQKYLMIFEFDHQLQHEPPFSVFYDDEKIGTMTSYAYNPKKNASSGLGYVKKNLAVADFNIKVDVFINNVKIPATIKIPPVNEV